MSWSSPRSMPAAARYEESIHTLRRKKKMAMLDLL
jgi:hypothetical protein